MSAAVAGEKQLKGGRALIRRQRGRRWWGNAEPRGELANSTGIETPLLNEGSAAEIEIVIEVIAVQY